VKRSFGPLSKGLTIALCALLVAGCERERRNFEPAISARALPGTNTDATQRASANLDKTNNAFALSEGKRLYGWYNCSGCHAQGGGDKGPALMDQTWIYGSAPADVYQSIVRGRPNGMPAFGDRIPDFEVWQLVAFVRSMSGLVPSDAATGRDDAAAAKQAENRTAQEPVTALHKTR
jgi:cytochrome c oxidase cbb3-type subunit 3